MTPDRGTWIFRASAAAALLLHASVLLRSDGLVGGADLLPHLRLMEDMQRDPALRSVYPPAYHLLGAWWGDWIGLAAFTRAFAFVSAAGLIAAFRSFQRAADLPDWSSAIFAWSPYLFALSWCTPKVEVAGYALALFALGRILKHGTVSVALALAATFAVHTAAALFLGLCGGALALAQRDRRALAALAVGALGALPLLGAHLAAGCSPAQSLLFSQGDYLRTAANPGTLAHPLRWLALAGPVGIAAAGFGASELWQRRRAVGVLCVVVLALVTNELWLAPFGLRTTLDLQRGLTLLALPVSLAAGVALARQPRFAAATLAACVVWGVATTAVVTPRSCFVRSFSTADVATVTVDRCTFRWRRAADARHPH